jgi:hypothetical protein
MSAGVIGDGDPIDGGTGCEVAGKGSSFEGAAFSHGASDGDELHSDEEAGRFAEFFAQRLHSFGS